MAKKIRFPLEMKDGVLVRTYEEFIEHFDLEKVLAYIQNGKLKQWLRDRSCTELADKVAEVSISDNDVAEKVSGIFGIEVEVSHADVKAINKKNEKKELLKKYTDDKEIFDLIDCVALEQQDVYELLEQGEKKIYLAGEQFEIPLDVSGVTYIGVNEPIVKISSEEVVDWKEKEIVIDGCVLDEKYAAIEEENLKVRRDVFWEYCPEIGRKREGKAYQLVGDEFKELKLHLTSAESAIGIVQCGSKIYHTTCTESKWDSDFDVVQSINEYNIDTGESRIIHTFAEGEECIDTTETFIGIKNQRIFATFPGCHGSIYDLDLARANRFDIKADWRRRDSENTFYVAENGKKGYYITHLLPSHCGFCVHEHDFEDDSEKEIWSVDNVFKLILADNKLLLFGTDGQGREREKFAVCHFMDLETGEKKVCEVYKEVKKLDEYISLFDFWMYNRLLATCAENILYWINIHDIGNRTNHGYRRQFQIASIDLITNQIRILNKIEQESRDYPDGWFGNEHMEVYDGYLYIYKKQWGHPLPHIRVNIETGEVQMLKNHKYVSL